MPNPPSITVSMSGTTLTALGIKHGPRHLRLPATTRLRSWIDQENVVTLFFDAPGDDVLLPHLRQALPAIGLRITDDKGGALLFAGNGWSGSYLSGADGVPVLTLRVA